jgi:hypothetical protein
MDLPHGTPQAGGAGPARFERSVRHVAGSARVRQGPQGESQSLKP